MICKAFTTELLVITENYAATKLMLTASSMIYFELFTHGISLCGLLFGIVKTFQTRINICSYRHVIYEQLR